MQGMYGVVYLVIPKDALTLESQFRSDGSSRQFEDEHSGGMRHLLGSWIVRPIAIPGRAS